MLMGIFQRSTSGPEPKDPGREACSRHAHCGDWHCKEDMWLCLFYKGHEMQVKQGSWFAPLQHLRGQLSGILSNPPYIAQHVMPSLQVSVQ